jgi:hypothetical protein
MRVQPIQSWEAKTLRTPRISIAFKPDVVICYDVKRGEVTDLFVNTKPKRVKRRQPQLQRLAVAAIAALALGVRPWLEVDL